MIVNLTRSPASPEQVAAGVADLPAPLRARVGELLTFNSPPLWGEAEWRAHELAKLAEEFYNSLPPSVHQEDSSSSPRVLIDCAPWFTAHLEWALWRVNMAPVYAFECGGKHLGFMGRTPPLRSFFTPM